MDGFSTAGEVHEGLGSAPATGPSRVLPIGPGELLFGEDDFVHAAYRVSTGLLLLSRRAQGRRMVVGFALPGDRLGGPSPTYGFSAEAVVETTLDASGPHRIAGRELADGAIDEIALASRHLLLLAHHEPEARLCAFLLSLERRRDRAAPGLAGTPLPLRRRDVAGYLGLTIETVGRVVARLERRHALLWEDGLALIVDPQRLASDEAGLQKGETGKKRR